MKRPFHAYDGDEPYVFVCYAHADQALVYPEITWLREQGINIWYDEGIAPGDEWSETLGRAIDNAAVLLYFVTPNSVASRHCRDEVHFANSHATAILAAHLQPAELPAGLELTLGPSQAIVKAELSADEFRAKLLQAMREPSEAPPSRVPQNRRPAASIWWGAAVLIALLVAALLYFRNAAPSEPGAPLTAIAVMPFDDLSPDGNQGWLANSLGDELINALSRVETFRVPGRRSTEIAKQREMDLPTIGQRLAVGSLVEGSVMRQDDALRIVVRLVSVVDGSQLWSGRYDRTLDDLFDMQTDMAISIAEALQAELGVGASLFAVQRVRNARYGTDDVRAYELLGKAWDAWSNLGAMLNSHAAQADFAQAVQRALDVDPNYPSAHVSLGHVQRLSGDAVASRASAERALALDSDNADALELLGYLAFDAHEWETAQRRFEQAIDAAPWSGTARNALAGVLQTLFRIDAALDHARRAADIDPLSSTVQTSAASILYAAGQYPEAIETARLAYDLGEQIANLWLQFSLAASGRDAEAAQMFLTGLRVRNTPPDWIAGVEAGIAGEGLAGGLRAFADRWQVECKDLAPPVTAMVVALNHAYVGYTDPMFACLEVATQPGHVLALPRWFSYPPFRPYLSDPRFREILREVNLESHARAAGLLD